MNSVKEKFYKFRGEVLEAPVDIICINEKKNRCKFSRLFKLKYNNNHH